jgi:hypothetical protein
MSDIGWSPLDVQGIKPGESLMAPNFGRDTPHARDRQGRKA